MALSKEGALVVSGGILALTGFIFWGTLQDKNRRLFTEEYMSPRKKERARAKTSPTDMKEIRQMSAFENAVRADARGNDFDARMLVLEHLLSR